MPAVGKAFQKPSGAAGRPARWNANENAPRGTIAAAGQAGASVVIAWAYAVALLFQRRQPARAPPPSASRANVEGAGTVGGGDGVKGVS
jgi:hypothetical protein